MICEPADVHWLLGNIFLHFFIGIEVGRLYIYSAIGKDVMHESLLFTRFKGSRCRHGWYGEVL